MLRKGANDVAPGVKDGVKKRFAIRCILIMPRGRLLHLSFETNRKRKVVSFRTQRCISQGHLFRRRWRPVLQQRGLPLRLDESHAE